MAIFRAHKITSSPTHTFPQLATQTYLSQATGQQDLYVSTCLPCLAVFKDSLTLEDADRTFLQNNPATQH
jgi:hypothetical protein